MKLSLLPYLLLLIHIGAHCQNDKTNASLLSDSAIKLWKNNKYDESLLIIKKALAIAQVNNDSLQIAKCLNNTGLIYNSKGDPVKSIFYYEQSLKILRNLKDTQEFPTALLNLGIAYKEQAIYDKALSYLFESLAYFEKRGDLKKQSSAYNAIGNINRVEKNFNKALEYHRTALLLRESIGYTEGVAGSLNSIGVVFKGMGQYDSAIIYLEKSIKKAAKQPRTEHYANTLSHIGEIYEKRGNFSLAKRYYDSAYTIRQRIDSKKGKAYSLLELGTLYYSANQFAVAIIYLEKSIMEANKILASDILLKCYGLLRKIYKAKNNYLKAFEYTDLYVELTTKILGEEKQKSLTQMQVKYETEKKQNEISQLNQEKERQANLIKISTLELQNRNKQIGFLIVLTVLLCVVLFFVVWAYRVRNKFAKKVDSLIHELHHRIKNNLQVLSSLFSLQTNYIKDEEAGKVMKSNISRIDAMILIHQELYFDKDISKIKIDDYINNLITQLQAAYQQPDYKKVKVNLDIDEHIHIETDKAIILGMLINELVTNSFKHAFGLYNANPTLELKLCQADGRYNLTIKDNGKGISDENFTKSFGLKLAYAQVKQLKGNLQVQTDGGLKYELTF